MGTEKVSILINYCASWEGERREVVADLHVLAWECCRLGMDVQIGMDGAELKAGKQPTHPIWSVCGVQSALLSF